MTAELQEDNRRLRAANAEVNALLANTAERLRTVLDDEAIVEKIPIEASTAMELAIESIDIVLEKLKAVQPGTMRLATLPGGSTSETP